MDNSRTLCPGRYRSRLWKWSLEVLRRLILNASIASAAFGADDRVTFLRDVAPILNKVGCTSGPCHGAAKGKNGFKLSLRGYDPSFDYQMLVHDVSGRRINRVDPPRSLALAKPTMQVAHGGGLRFDLDSRYYQTFLQWIAQGTPYGDPESSQVKRLEVFPGEVLMPKPGLSQQMQIIAHYADGATR